MKRLLVLVCFLSACGGSSPATPSGPPPPPAAANLSTEGQGSWVNCLPAVGLFPGSCQFQGDARNTGAGCGTAVRGVVRFFNANQTQIGPASDWTLASTRILRPNEAFVYVATSQELSIVNAARTYRWEPSWTNVACP